MRSWLFLIITTYGLLASARNQIIFEDANVTGVGFDCLLLNRNSLTLCYKRIIKGAQNNEEIRLIRIKDLQSNGPTVRVCSDDSLHINNGCCKIVHLLASNACAYSVSDESNAYRSFVAKFNEEGRVIKKDISDKLEGRELSWFMGGRIRTEKFGCVVRISDGTFYLFSNDVSCVRLDIPKPSNVVTGLCKDDQFYLLRQPQKRIYEFERRSILSNKSLEISPQTPTKNMRGIQNMESFAWADSKLIYFEECYIYATDNLSSPWVASELNRRPLFERGLKGKDIEAGFSETYCLYEDECDVVRGWVSQPIEELFVAKQTETPGKYDVESKFKTEAEMEQQMKQRKPSRFRALRINKKNSDWQLVEFPYSSLGIVFALWMAPLNEGSWMCVVFESGSNFANSCLKVLRFDACEVKIFDKGNDFMFCRPTEKGL